VATQRARQSSGIFRSRTLTDVYRPITGLAGTPAHAHPLRFVAVPAGFLLIGAGFVVDVTTGRDLSLSIAYVAGVGFLAWYGGRALGLLGAAGAAAAVLTDGLANSVAVAVSVWNALVALAFLVVVVLVLVRIRTALDREQSQARFDPLTGIPNRRACEERGELELGRMRRNGGSLSVAFLDLDGLKQLNDRHGHAAGDAALVRLARSAQAILRPTDLLARVGGDEFVLLLPDTDSADAVTVTRRLQHALDTGDDLAVPITVGLVTWHTPPQNLEDLFVEADALMYNAKRSRGERFESQVIGQRRHGRSAS
jgi:diguanylate cyclase (GGDEF)-like protein